MTARSIALLCALFVTFVAASSACAEPEGERDVSLSIFAGRALIEAPDIGVQQPAPFIDGEALDVELGANHFVGGLAMHF